MGKRQPTLPIDVIDTLKRLKKLIEVKKLISVIRNAVRFYDEALVYRDWEIVAVKRTKKDIKEKTYQEIKPLYLPTDESS